MKVCSMSQWHLRNTRACKIELYVNYFRLSYDFCSFKLLGFDIDICSERLLRGIFSTHI